MDIDPLTCTSEQLYSIMARGSMKTMLLALSNPAMTEQHLISLLRNPAVTPPVIQAICDRLDWASSYDVQCALVNCPKSPMTLALRLLPVLFWRDLLKTSQNFRLSPRIRRSAENYLRDKIRELTAGEKTTLARTSPRPIIKLILKDRDIRIVEALLRNPNLVEDDVLQIVNDELTPPRILSLIAADYKWSLRYSIRLSLIRNKNSPLPVVLAFVSKLKRSDLQALLKNPEIPELLRRTAERILAGNY